MGVFITEEEIMEELGVSEVTEALALAFTKIELQIRAFIIPNRIKPEDAEMFKQASLLQYHYMQTQEYKTASLKSFSIGKFSGVKSDRGSGRISPEVLSLLGISGYLYRGLEGGGAYDD